MSEQVREVCGVCKGTGFHVNYDGRKMACKVCFGTGWLDMSYMPKLPMKAGVLPLKGKKA